MVKIRSAFFGGKSKSKNPLIGGIQKINMTAEEKMKKVLEARARERNEFIRAQEFEHELARKTQLVSEKKAEQEARKKLEEIIGLELNKNLSRVLSSFLIESIGHQIIDQLAAQGNLKKFLVQSPALKLTIESLKSGQRIQKNQFNSAANELREMIRQMGE